MVVFTGASVDAAIEKGLASLELTRTQVTITVLAKEKKGFLGLFGKKDAQVDLVPLVSEAIPETSIASSESGQLLSLEASEPIGSVEKEPVEVVSVESDQAVVDDFEAFVAKEFNESRPEEGGQTGEQARQDVLAYVEKIIYEMDLEATITVKGSRRQMILQIETPEPGRIIGYHGKVLKSLQLLAQNFLHDRYSRHFNVVLNVHDYLEHRMETLVDMANKAARRVLETGKPYRLDPMTNHERKMVHKTISGLSGVESYSEGDDPDRYVVIVSRDHY